jgi:hypothetical protein
MKQTSSPSALTVTRSEQLPFLLEPSQRRYLEPFMAQERTISQAAAEIEVQPNTLLYAVRRMLACGLLVVARCERRKGRAIKVYRSSAEVFFLPHTALSQGGLEEAIAQVDLEGEQLLRRNIVYARSDRYPSWGFRMFRSTDGLVFLNAGLDAQHDLDWLALGSPAAFSIWSTSIHLDFADAKALQNELFALMERYRRKQGSQTYVLRLGMAPLLKNQAIS